MVKEGRNGWFPLAKKVSAWHKLCACLFQKKIIIIMIDFTLVRNCSRDPFSYWPQGWKTLGRYHFKDIYLTAVVSARGVAKSEHCGPPCHDIREQNWVLCCPVLNLALTIIHNILPMLAGYNGSLGVWYRVTTDGTVLHKQQTRWVYVQQS